MSKGWYRTCHICGVAAVGLQRPPLQHCILVAPPRGLRAAGGRLHVCGRLGLFLGRRLRLMALRLGRQRDDDTVARALRRPAAALLEVRVARNQALAGRLARKCCCCILHVL